MKTYIILLITIIVLISGCDSTKLAENKVNDGNSVIIDAKVDVKLPEDTTQDNSKWTDLTPPEEKKEDPKKPTCEEWAETLIPVNVKLYEGQTKCERSLSGVWKDGTPIKINNRKIEFVNNANKNLKMEPGSQAGEKVDEFYLKSYGGDILTFKYEKNAQDSEGTIIGVDEFEVKVESYKKLEESMITAEELGCAYYEYKIGDYELLSCTKN